MIDQLLADHIGQITTEIAAELERQDTLHGDQIQVSLHERMTITTEEFGKLAKAILTAEHAQPINIAAEYECAQHEAIETIACLFRVWICLERQIAISEDALNDAQSKRPIPRPTPAEHDISADVANLVSSLRNLCLGIEK